MLIQMAISRSREYEADAGGARFLGTGEPLARALEKIDVYAKQIPMAKVNPAQENAVHHQPVPRARPRGQAAASQPGRRTFANYFRTHPATEDRVARLRAMQFQS